MGSVIEENGHRFVPGSEVGLKSLANAYMCRACGIIRRDDGKNKSCRGTVKVELRGGAWQG